MTDLLATGLDALGRTPVPLAWSDVEALLAVEAHLDVGLDAPPAGDGRPRRTRLLVAAAVLATGGVVAALAWPDDGRQPVTTGPADATTTRPAPTTSAPGTSSTATTVPATGTSWHTAATAWTGAEYLVWGGQAGGDGTGRADGWRYGPATGGTRAIPVAPIAPRDEAAGAWTGTELIVCCGLPLGDGPAYDTASAAAYDPATDTWRVLAPPPPETAGSTLGAVWTGTELLVVSAVEDDRYAVTGLLLHAYDPATDRWSRRADPLFGDRIGHLAWSGTQLVAWTTGYTAPPHQDRGQVYDPSTDTWSPLPELPADHRPWYASAAWVGDQLVVWGIDQEDEVATVGYRWRPGETSWRPVAPAPIDPVNWYEGTPGSQTVTVEPDTGRLIVVSVDPGTIGEVAPRPLLSYDPVADRWERLGEAPALGYGAIALLAGDLVLQPDRTDPVAFELPG